MSLLIRYESDLNVSLETECDTTLSKGGLKKNPLLKESDKVVRVSDQVPHGYNLQR